MSEKIKKFAVRKKNSQNTTLMKKSLLLALVAAAAASCQKDDIEIAEQDIVSDYPAECNLITFKAGQEGAESTHVLWHRRKGKQKIHS